MGEMIFGSLLQYFSFQEWALGAFSLAVTALLLPGLKVTSIFGPLLTVITLSFVNTHLWDVALFFQVPDSLTTQAGLLVLVNGVIFGLLIKLLPGIEINRIRTAFIAPILFSILSVVITKYGKEVDWIYVGERVVDLFSYLKSYFLYTPASSPQ